MIEIKPMLPDQWQLYKTVRCAALANAPYAFSSKLEDALERSDEDWQRMTHQYASHPNSLTYLAFLDDVVCGMAACVVSGDVVDLYGFWVDPAYRRKGVGRALVNYGLDWSRSKSSSRIRVGVFEDNPAALVFYKSLGFTHSHQVDPILSTKKRAVLLYTLLLK